MSTSNSDLNGIHEFLQDFPSYSYDAESWSPYTNSAAVPRQTLVYDTQSMAGMDPYDDGSVQTAEYAASTATYTTGQQSLFDRPHTGAASSVGQSSAPSRGTGRVTFPQQFALDPAPVYQGYPAPDYHLWCEFRVLKNCNVFFRGDDEAGWIQHHARHLKDRFPSQVVCWFCDHIPFVAQNTADRRANFEWRMQHIREHINSDYCVAEQMRPDFHIVEHMYEHGQIDKSTYKSAMSYSELPPSLRLPESAPASGQSRGSSYGATQVYDLQKEQRQWRKQQEAKKKEKKTPW